MKLYEIHTCLTSLIIDTFLNTLLEYLTYAYFMTKDHVSQSYSGQNNYFRIIIFLFRRADQLTQVPISWDSTEWKKTRREDLVKNVHVLANTNFVFELVTLRWVLSNTAEHLSLNLSSPTG